MDLSLHHGILPWGRGDQVDLLARESGFTSVEAQIGWAFPPERPVRMANHLRLPADDETIHRVVAAAQRLGAPTLQVVVGNAELDDALSQLLRVTRERVVLAVEPVAFSPWTLNEYVRALRKLDDPNLLLCLDTWHLAAAGHDPDELTDFPADLIQHVHLSDGVALESDRDRFVVPGYGVVPVEAYVRALRTAGYSGTYGVEILDPPGPRAAAAAAYERAAEILGFTA